MNLFFLIAAIVLFALLLIERGKTKSLRNQLKLLQYDYDELKKSLTRSIESNFFIDFPRSSYEKKSNRPKVTASDIEYFESKKIEKKYLYPIKDLEDNGNHFYGKKVVITGDFISYESRNEMAKILWELGADVDVSIGKYTDILIIGENPGYSKMETILDTEIEVIDEDTFNSLI